jgi:dihydroorotate dehydrogenase electron transfer subunit
LAKKLGKSDKIHFAIGAKSKDELLFLKELSNICTTKSLTTTTDDGTFGLQCMVTEPLKDLIGQEKFDMIYACGPEIMIKKLVEMAEKNKIPMEASLERLMRCGIGLCGSCVIGKYRVCHDGPVFNSKQLHEIKDELGMYKMGFDGSQIPI